MVVLIASLQLGYSSFSYILPIMDLESVVFPQGSLVLEVERPNVGPGMLTAVGLIIISRSQINFNTI